MCGVRRLTGVGIATLVGLVALAMPLLAAAQPVSTLVPVGGGYTEASLEGFARAVAAHASGATVDILVVPSSYGDSPKERDKNIKLATDRTQQVAAACNAVVDRAVFAQGCTATLLLLFDRADAENLANSAAFYDPATDGAFILGGDQDVAMEVLAGTPTEAAMQRAYSRGVVFGGTSAGAAVESHTMIAGFTGSNGPESGLERDAVDVWWADNAGTHRGLVFGSDRAIYDQHFYQRGRFGRLLNVVALSGAHFGGDSRLGIAADYGTGMAVTDDALLTGVFGASSVAVFDERTAGGTYRWVRPRQTLSARNVLTQIIPPGDYGYDLVTRRPLVAGSPLTYTPQAGWDGAALRSPGAATLILGGDVSLDWTGSALGAFTERARTSPSHRLVVVAIGDKNSGQQRSAGSDYANGLATAGWAGSDYAVDVLKYGPPSQTPKLDTSRLAGAAGVLFIGSDQSALAPAVADPNFAALVRYALANTPVVMTDRAMTAAMGDWYVANPDPTATNVEDLAIADFRAGGANVQPGLGIVHGFAFEPRLTLDQRWGRLYGLAAAHHNTIAVGVSEMTALVLDGGGATVVGQRSVVALDGRGATFGTGTNGALAALDVLLDTFAPGDRVAPGR